MLEQDINRYVISLNINGNRLDLADVNKFYFIEDITNTCMFGYLSFYDRIGSFELLPITGHELIGVNYGENEDEMFEKYFSIFQIKNVSQVIQHDGSSLSLIELYIVDPLFYLLNQFRYSISWPDNTLVTDIIKDICKNMLYIEDNSWSIRESPAAFEDCNEKISNFCMPQWTPNETIKYLMKRISSKKTGTPGYLFYSDMEGLNLMTLESFFQEKELERDIEGNEKHYAFTTNNSQDDCKIISWSLHPIDYQSTNYLKGSTKLGFDFEKKNYFNTPNTYKTTLDKFTLLGRKTFFPDISDPDQIFDYEGDNNYDFLENISTNEILMRYIDEFSVVITVRGAVRRYVGMLIDIMWDSTSATEYYHKALHGKYIVKSITNYFDMATQPYFQQKMVLLKVAYSESDYVSLMDSKKYIKIISNSMGATA